MGILVGVFMTRGAAAQETPPAPENVGPLTPPVLAAQASASYPQQALRERREADVGLELKLDESGAVVDAKVTEPAGHGFDEAALAAARSFRFEPARNAGVAIGATVQFVYEFRLPESAPQTHAPKPDAPPKPLEQAGPQQSTLVLATRPISAASSFSVRDRDFQLRPIASVQDILRVTPGLVVVQHSGGGKANQYFLRGFDADHGTDLALSLDGVPINLVSHAHGQGFSDTNFVIPELVERIEISKGPYFASQGDFATAGAVNLVSREGFEHSSLGLGVSGSPGHGKLGYRGLVIASPKLAWARATFAAELGRSNGPFEHPDRWDRYKLFNKLSIAPTPSSTLSVTELSYSGNWNGSGQIPARAVEQGLISRFGALDPDEGGNSARHQVFSQYSVRPNESSELKALAYVGRYRFNLFSNFTLFLHDPEQGDEIEQIDRRTFYGGRLSYRAVHDLGRLRFDTTVGADARNDDIHAELWHTVERRQLTALRSNGIHQSMVGVFVNEELTPARWVRMNLGGRADFLSFAVDSPLASAGSEAPLSGVDAAQQFSPKGSLIVSPLEGLDLFANYGHGFHSNDVRGAFSTPRVNPLTRAVGVEVGARTRLFERWDLAATIWQLDLDDETVWAGDEGTTEVSDATRRRGLEFETRYELTPWLAERDLLLLCQADGVPRSQMLERFRAHPRAVLLGTDSFW